MRLGNASDDLWVDTFCHEQELDNVVTEFGEICDRIGVAGNSRGVARISMCRLACDQDRSIRSERSILAFSLINWALEGNIS